MNDEQFKQLRGELRGIFLVALAIATMLLLSHWLG
jgi:hypothetical protein